MGVKLGFQAKLYLNTGTYDSPTWSEISNTQDNTLDLQSDEADVSTRAGNGFKEVIQGMFQAGCDFEMLWNTSDTNFTAIRAAAFSRTPLEFLALDGSVDVDGSQGLRALMAVLNVTRKEPLGNAMTATVSIKPTVSDNPPDWYTASA